MEHTPSGQEDEHLSGALELASAAEVQRIREGIAEALRDGGTIDDETACLIANALTPGSGALHQFAMTGEIGPEIGSDLETAYEVVSVDVAETWVAALDGYCFRRRDKGAVPGWRSKNS
jgi:hypothetical protein